MQVTFSRTGGFAPMPIGCTLDTEKMPAEDAQTLDRLVRESGVMSLKDARVQGARDVHIFSIAVTDGQQQQKVTLDQLSVPATAKPLVDFLCKHSQSLLPED